MATVLFLADKFSDVRRDRRSRYPGGAELTDETAITASPHRVTARRFREASPKDVRKFDIVVIANADKASRALLQALVDAKNHVLFEHDLRVCRWRGNFPVSPEPVHRFAQVCNCRHRRWQDVFATARGVVFLTKLQQQRYHENPYYLPNAREAVLGCSLFEPNFVQASQQMAKSERAGTLVFASRHRIKGHRLAVEYCKQHDYEYTEVSNLPYPKLLETMATARRFVYLPLGMEPAGRMPVEARLLGCEAIVNKNLGVAGESFFRGSGVDARAHLASAPRRFWQMVDEFMASEPAASHRRHTGLRRKLLTARPLLTVAKQRSANGAYVADRVAQALADVQVLPSWLES